mmetsp:Transcript_54967/g.154199  ORF Transcript_54967/g.154199 Transcript_54967/m.154199 type:complete len:149 (+) Transcript_54967:861-1307(+)
MAAKALPLPARRFDFLRETTGEVERIRTLPGACDGMAPTENRTEAVAAPTTPPASTGGANVVVVGARVVVEVRARGLGTLATAVGGSAVATVALPRAVIVVQRLAGRATSQALSRRESRAPLVASAAALHVCGKSCVLSQRRIGIVVQ